MPLTSRSASAGASLAVALSAAVVLGGLAPGATAAAGVTVMASSTPEYDLVLEVVDGDTLVGQAQGSHLTATFHNLTDSELHLGLAADLAVEGVEQRLWLPGTFGLEVGEEQNLPFGQAVSAGTTLQQDLPNWPGMTFWFYLLDPAGVQEPVLIGSYTAGGQHVPVSIDLGAEPESVQIGRTATFSGTEAFPGVTATVMAAGLTPGDNLQLWLTHVDYWAFLASGAQLPPDAVNVGNATVAPDGTLSAPFVVPAGLPFANYQLLVGNPVGRNWPAGTTERISIVPAPQSGSVETAGSGVPVSIELGPTSVTFTFGSLSVAGTATAASSATGPIADGFTMATHPTVYYHLSTTATFSGNVEICISFDPATLTGGPPNLYHQKVTRDGDGAIVSTTWQNITSSRSTGVVCGFTDSFSPFALGHPVGVQLATKEECKNGGWATSTLPTFKNQGACVSYFTAKKK